MTQTIEQKERAEAEAVHAQKVEWAINAASGETELLLARALIALREEQRVLIETQLKALHRYVNTGHALSILKSVHPREYALVSGIVVGFSKLVQPPEKLDELISKMIKEEMLCANHTSVSTLLQRLLQIIDAGPAGPDWDRLECVADTIKKIRGWATMGY